jgi:hypothetical protein
LNPSPRLTSAQPGVIDNSKHKRHVDVSGERDDGLARKHHHRQQQPQPQGASRFEQWDWKKVIFTLCTRRVYFVCFFNMQCCFPAKYLYASLPFTKC